MKIKQENILWPIKNFGKYFMAHQYMTKIFHELHKDPPARPPMYLMDDPYNKNNSGTKCFHFSGEMIF